MTAPRKDPHFLPTLQTEQAQTHIHKQATAQMAAERAWYWRPVWYEGLIPDTRKCFQCGQEVFEPMVLTDEEKNIRSPMSTQDIAGPTYRWV